MSDYPFSLFEVYGVELEYMVVDKKTLNILPIVDILFQDIAGEITSSIEQGDLTLDNELVSHVVELKPTEPVPRLEGMASKFHNKVKELNQLLEKHNARLMPTAMHPWMDPLKETKIWAHGPKEIYDRFNAIFNCKGHGWSNLQSAHINLPFASEEEFVKLHRAIRIVLPLIPMIAASSPYVDGKHTGVKDNRLKVYRDNSKKIFSIAGHIIPEVSTSYKDYQTNILEKIYSDLNSHDPEGILKHEWVNARGAITRFERGAIEIRLIDIQENPYQDLGIVTAITRLIQHLIKTPQNYDQFDEERLKKILWQGIDHAEEALIDDLEYLKLFGIYEKVPGKALWMHIIDKILKIRSPELDLILKEGTLATRIEKSKKPLFETYQKLCDCLEKAEPFVP